MEDIKLINCNCKFTNGPFIEILDNHSSVYIIEFYEKIGNDWGLVYTNNEFPSFSWFSYLRKFRTKWMIKVWGMENELPILLFQHTYDENNKKVLLLFDSPVFETHLKWIYNSESFSKKFNCEIIVSSRFSDRLKKIYNGNVSIIDNKINFNDYCDNNNIYASYTIGKKDIQSNTWDFWESKAIFENHAKHYDSWHHPENWIKFSDEDLFNNILGL